MFVPLVFLILPVTVAFTTVAGFAESEHEIMVARAKDGLAAARARGRFGGRKPKMIPERVNQARKLYDEGSMTVKQIADLFGVSRPTIYRALDGRWA